MAGNSIRCVARLHVRGSYQRRRLQRHQVQSGTASVAVPVPRPARQTRRRRSQTREEIERDLLKVRKISRGQVCKVPADAASRSTTPSVAWRWTSCSGSARQRAAAPGRRPLRPSPTWKGAAARSWCRPRGNGPHASAAGADHRVGAACRVANAAGRDRGRPGMVDLYVLPDVTDGGYTDEVLAEVNVGGRDVRHLRGGGGHSMDDFMITSDEGIHRSGEASWSRGARAGRDRGPGRAEEKGEVVDLMAAMHASLDAMSGEAGQGEGPGEGGGEDVPRPRGGPRGHRLVAVVETLEKLCEIAREQRGDDLRIRYADGWFCRGAAASSASLGDVQVRGTSTIATTPPPRAPPRWWTCRRAPATSTRRRLRRQALYLRLGAPRRSEQMDRTAAELRLLLPSAQRRLKRHLDTEVQGWKHGSGRCSAARPTSCPPARDG